MTLDVVDRLRPVVLQQPRKRAVREKLPAGLAARAVVALVLGVDDSLHRRIAYRAGLAVPSVHGHSLPKGGHGLGKTRSHLAPQDVGPAVQRGARCLVQARDLLGRQRPRQLQGRQPGGVQDLVGIGVADAAEEVRVGEGALERVILAVERRGEFLARNVERLDAAGIERLQRRLSAHHHERCALLRPGLGEEERAPREME